MTTESTFRQVRATAMAVPLHCTAPLPAISHLLEMAVVQYETATLLGVIFPPPREPHTPVAGSASA